MKKTDGVSDSARWEPRKPFPRPGSDGGRCEGPGEDGEGMGTSVCLGEGRATGAGPLRRATGDIGTHRGDIQRC